MSLKYGFVSGTEEAMNVSHIFRPSMFRGLFFLVETGLRFSIGSASEMKETFAMFEVDGAITTHQLGLALRAMGQNPSEGEIQTLASSAELSGTNSHR